MRTCWPTRNFSLLKRRVRSAFPCILYQIFKTSASLTSAGAIPVVEWTVTLYPLTNLGRTSIYLYVFLKVKYQDRLSRSVLLTCSTTAHLTSGFLQNSNSIPLRFSSVWNWVFKNSFPLSVRSHTGRRRMDFVYLVSCNIVASAAATSFPIFVVEVRYADTLKTRQLPAVDTYNYYYISSIMTNPKYRFPKRHRYYWQYMDFWGSVFWGAGAAYMHLASLATPLSDLAFSSLFFSGRSVSNCLLKLA